MATNPDAIAESFIKHYDIVTHKDLAELNARLDRIEYQLKAYANGQNFPVKYKAPRGRSKVTSTDVIYDERSKNGLNFSEIQAFEDGNVVSKQK
jgi:hypothetical protein